MSRQPDRASSVTDDRILKEVMKSLREEFPGTKGDREKILNFNVTCKGKVIELKGFVRGSKMFTRVLRAVKSVPSFDKVKALNVKGFNPATKGKCDPKTEKPCRGGCIGIEEHCNEIG
jgi:hypothetical protein